MNKMSLTIEELKTRVEEFDRKVGWDKTEFNQLVDFIQEELDNLKASSGDKERVNHLLTDLLILIMQIGYRYKTDFSSEIEKWFNESKSE